MISTTTTARRPAAAPRPQPRAGNVQINAARATRVPRVRPQGRAAGSTLPTYPHLRRGDLFQREDPRGTPRRYEGGRAGPSSPGRPRLTDPLAAARAETVGSAAAARVGVVVGP